ncbi:methylmalonyl-CoA mutase family protein [Streptomyces sp. NPDC058659]|uniref:methylmalonyl-CoA mutase family protein n=1 Tax=Streptomyces sp. NPDC058659 TaxID=3346581 RepID=UPI003648FA73
MPRWTTVSVEGPEPYEPVRAAPGIEERQAERLAKLRAWRCGDRVHRTLAAVTAAAGGDDDLMPPMKEALAAGATVGEVCDALREAWGPSRPLDTQLGVPLDTQLDTQLGVPRDTQLGVPLDAPIGAPVDTTV